MTRKRASRTAEQLDPHGVARAERGVVTCNCGQRFTGQSTGESWDKYYSHWALKSRVQ
jgi:hypothetical protein